MKLKILISAVLLVPALGWGQVSDADRRFIDMVKVITRLDDADKQHQKNFVDLVAVIHSLEKRIDALERRGR